MPAYAVQHPYFSRRDGQTFGPWVEGDEPDLTDEEAEWINRDSPGALAPVVDKPKVEPKREAEPAKDRQQRAGRNR